MRGPKDQYPGAFGGMVPSAMLRRCAIAIPFFALAAISPAQSADPLTLAEALEMAKMRNGTIRSAMFDLRASKARRESAFASFLPNVTPSLQYQNSRTEFSNQFGNQSTSIDEKTTRLSGDWRLLDTGQRSLSYRASQRNERATEFNLSQTVRQTLFNVTTQYYETLRAQALQTVADTQVTRANAILDQTKTRVDVGDAARKDILQAQADALNAQVNALASRNRTNSSAATLKATIGLDNERPLPPLEQVDVQQDFDPSAELAALIADGLAKRPDIQARRQSIEAAKYELRRTEIEAGVTVSVDASTDFFFTPDERNNRSFTVLLSYPLFDGGARRAAVREQKAGVESAKAELLQSERTARAEIESAFLEYRQNLERLRAAQAAVEAARLNYQAAQGAQQLGAGDLIEVLTAQVSLVTAESNYIEAVYDTLISELQLKVATGNPIPGELE